MLTIPYEPPAYRVHTFNCPNCHALAPQTWHSVWYKTTPALTSSMSELPLLDVSICSHCSGKAYWFGEILFYPASVAEGVAPPNSELDQTIQGDYIEASNIVADSPRGAAAILRLCLQKLCVQLGEKGNDLNGDIGKLVKRGLPVGVQEALDIVRLTGNESVHPGSLDLKDDVNTAMRLFELVNLIADKMISEPKRLEEFYQRMPEGKREQIKKRDESADK